MWTVGVQVVIMRQTFKKWLVKQILPCQAGVNRGCHLNRKRGNRGGVWRDFRKRERECVCVCVRERRKIELTEWGKKVPISLDGIQTCTSGIRTHRASDYTTRVRPPRVSRNKHFSHSPVISTAKQSCMKHSNSYLRNCDAKHLQGPPLSRMKRVRERRKIELTEWGKKVHISSTGFEPVPLGYAPTVLLITPRG